MQPSRCLRRAANRSFWQRIQSLPAAKSACFSEHVPLQTASNSIFSTCKGCGLQNVKNDVSRVPNVARSASLYQFRLQRRTFMGLGDGDEDSGLSKHYEETRVVGYTPEQLFAVVAAVDLYEDFVPWCQRSNVLWQTDEALEAELQIGFKFLIERYISHVELIRPSLIKTSVSKSNLFEYLINTWEFKAGPKPGTCSLHFSVKFQFRSPLYRHVANMFFQEVVAHLVSSFEGRCNKVYGPSTKTLEKTQAA